MTLVDQQATGDRLLSPAEWNAQGQRRAARRKPQPGFDVMSAASECTVTDVAGRLLRVEQPFTDGVIQPHTTCGAELR